MTHPWTDEDPDADRRVEPSETTEDILALYRGEGDASREIVAASSARSSAASPGSEPWPAWW